MWVLASACVAAAIFCVAEIAIICEVIFGAILTIAPVGIAFVSSADGG